MRRVILHPPTLSSYLPPSPPFRRPAWLCTGPASRTLSFIVSTIYDSVYTGGSGGGDDIRPFRDVLKFRSDSSARDRSYILAGDSTAHHAPFYSWYLHFSAPSSHFASRKLRAVELSLPKLRYHFFFFLRNFDKNLSLTLRVSYLNNLIINPTENSMYTNVFINI